MGASGAIIAAAAARAERRVLDAFRDAGATSPGVVIALPESRPMDERLAERLLRAGAIRTGDRGYWLDEAAYAAYQRRRQRTVVLVMATLLAVLLFVGLVLLALGVIPTSRTLR